MWLKLFVQDAFERWLKTFYIKGRILTVRFYKTQVCPCLVRKYKTRVRSSLIGIFFIIISSEKCLGRLAQWKNFGLRDKRNRVLLPTKHRNFRVLKFHGKIYSRRAKLDGKKAWISGIWLFGRTLLFSYMWNAILKSEEIHSNLEFLPLYHQNHQRLEEEVCFSSHKSYRE
jgi:hypothetical protein